MVYSINTYTHSYSFIKVPGASMLQFRTRCFLSLLFILD